tara:strand:+ start:482 stop:814 length:333 start_codon:yes stop_codon:yes gene_type:complete
MFKLPKLVEEENKKEYDEDDVNDEDDVDDVNDEVDESDEDDEDDEVNKNEEGVNKISFWVNTTPRYIETFTYNNVLFDISRFKPCGICERPLYLSENIDYCFKCQEKIDE